MSNIVVKNTDTKEIEFRNKRVMVLLGFYIISMVTATESGLSPENEILALGSSEKLKKRPSGTFRLT